MFSGIVTELGTVQGNGISSGQLEIVAPNLAATARVGDSLAVDGCCLTVVTVDGALVRFDVMPETVRRTNLGERRDGDSINLEPAMALGDRVGGHLVSGHIDDAVVVHEIRDEGNARWVSIDLPLSLRAYVVPQGCVALDGISLTVVAVEPDRFTVSLIPHTLAVTRAQAWRPGVRVNLETDLVAKYVDRSVSVHMAAAPTR